MIAAQRAGDAPGDRASLRASIWEARLVLAARIAGIDLAQLGPAKSAPDKVLLATVLKLTTDVSNRWLGERLAMGTPASAGEFAGRFVRRGGSKRLREVLQRLQDDSPSEAGPRRSTRSVSSRCGPRIAS